MPLRRLYTACFATHPRLAGTYANQRPELAVCTVICIVVSLATAPPNPEQVNDDLVVNWKRLNIFSELGTTWYNSVVTWWLLFCSGDYGAGGGVLGRLAVARAAGTSCRANARAVRSGATKACCDRFAPST